MRVNSSAQIPSSASAPPPRLEMTTWKGMPPTDVGVIDEGAYGDGVPAGFMRSRDFAPLLEVAALSPMPHLSSLAVDDGQEETTAVLPFAAAASEFASYAPDAADDEKSANGRFEALNRGVVAPRSL